MKKILVAVRFVALTTFVVVFASSFSYASQARLSGMGLEDWMVEDDMNIWLSPAYINNYPNRIWGELGMGGTGVAGNELLYAQYAGVSLGWLGTGGLFAGRPYTGDIGNIGDVSYKSDLSKLTKISPVWYSGETQTCNVTLLRPSNNLDIFYGLGLGNLLKLGFRGTFAGAKDDWESSLANDPKKNGDGSVKLSRSSYDINVGAGLTIGQLGPIPQLDVYAEAGLPIVETTYSEQALDATKDKYKTLDISRTGPGSFTVLAGARAKLTLWNLKFIVNGSYGFKNLSGLLTSKKDADADGTIDGNSKQEVSNVSHIVNAGIALNHQIGDKTLLVFAGGVKYNLTNDVGVETDSAVSAKQEYRWSSNAISVPVNIGIEHKLPFWGLVGRAGASFVYTMTTLETYNPTYDSAGEVTDEGKTKTITPGNEMAISLGLGKQITDALSVDLLVRQSAFWDEGLLGALTTQMSLMYKF